MDKKYSQIIVNGVPCFGESNGKLLVYMQVSLGGELNGMSRQYKTIAEIYYDDISLYNGDLYFIWGAFSKPVMSLTKEVYLTQRQYDNLPDTKLTNGYTYYIVED